MSFQERKKDKETTWHLPRSFQEAQAELIPKKKKVEQLMSFQERKKDKKQPDTYLDRFKKPKPNLFLKKESKTVNVVLRKKKRQETTWHLPRSFQEAQAELIPKKKKVERLISFQGRKKRQKNNLALT